MKTSAGQLKTFFLKSISTLTHYTEWIFHNLKQTTNVVIAKCIEHMSSNRDRIGNRTENVKPRGAYIGTD